MKLWARAVSLCATPPRARDETSDRAAPIVIAAFQSRVEITKARVEPGAAIRFRSWIATRALLCACEVKIERTAVNACIVLRAPICSSGFRLQCHKCQRDEHHSEHSRCSRHLSSWTKVDWCRCEAVTAGAKGQRPSTERPLFTLNNEPQLPRSTITTANTNRNRITEQECGRDAAGRGLRKRLLAAYSLITRRSPH